MLGPRWGVPAGETQTRHGLRPDCRDTIFLMFQGLEHTAIASPNPEKLANWYVDHLGFHINFAYGGDFFIKGPNGNIIEIIPSEGSRPPQVMANNKNPGIRHLAIAVDDFNSAW